MSSIRRVTTKNKAGRIERVYICSDISTSVGARGLIRTLYNGYKLYNMGVRYEGARHT